MWLKTHFTNDRFSFSCFYAWCYFWTEINIFSIMEIYLMEELKSSYLFIALGAFFIRMTRYYLPLHSINLLSVKLFLKPHMKIVQDLLSTTLPCLFIMTHKVFLFFFNLVLEFFQLLLICTYFFWFWKTGLFKVPFGSICLSLNICRK